MGGDVFGGCHDVGEVAVVVVGEGGGDGDDVGVGVDHSGGCREVAAGEGLGELFLEAWFDDGDLTIVDAVDGVGVDVDTGNVEAVVGHDDGGGQADVAEPYKGNSLRAHVILTLVRIG